MQRFAVRSRAPSFAVALGLVTALPATIAAQPRTGDPSLRAVIATGGAPFDEFTDY
jgi:hypothetical protein